MRGAEEKQNKDETEALWGGTAAVLRAKTVSLLVASTPRAAKTFCRSQLMAKIILKAPIKSQLSTVNISSDEWGRGKSAMQHKWGIFGFCLQGFAV